jgi:hypothetical protein
MRLVQASVLLSVLAAAATANALVPIGALRPAAHVVDADDRTLDLRAINGKPILVDFWPARGFVKDAIRGESSKVGATIYCDWDGTFQRAAGFKRGTSSVLLVGRDARVLFAFEGALPKAERERLIALLRVEVEAVDGS